jgi:hypothetical protein
MHKRDDINVSPPSLLMFPRAVCRRSRSAVQAQHVDALIEWAKSEKRKDADSAQVHSLSAFATATAFSRQMLIILFFSLLSLKRPISPTFGTAASGKT